MTTLELGIHSAIDPPAEGDEPCAGRVLIVDQSGPVWMLRCEGCDWEAGLPARKADPAIRERLRYQEAGFPARFAGKHFEQDPTNRPVVKALHDWLVAYPAARLPAPALWGNPGIGKSHALVVLCERLIRERAVAVLFRSIAKLLDELQEAFDRPGAHGLIWQRALTVEVLALDDLGAERPTEWRTDRLARLVDERWERELPVLIATNYPPHLWDEAFDARTASRLRGMTFAIEMRGVDRRQLPLAEGTGA